MPPSLTSASTTTITTGSSTRNRNGGSTRAPSGTRSSSGQISIISPAAEAAPSTAADRRGGRRSDGDPGLSGARPAPADAPRRPAASGGPRILVTCGANDGDSTTTSRTGPAETTSPVGEHDDLVGDPGHELHVVGGHHHRRAVLGQPGQGGRRARASRCSRARGSARRAAPARGRPASTIASTSASRCPWERSRGCRSPGMPGTSRSSTSRQVPASTPARVRGGALLVHGLEVEQVVGVLRHQPDAGPAGRRVQPGGVGTGDGDPARRTPTACPGASTAASTCPAPLRPITAQTRPARTVRSTSRSDHPLAAGHAEPGGGEHLVADARVRRRRRRPAAPPSGPGAGPRAPTPAAASTPGRGRAR